MAVLIALSAAAFLAILGLVRAREGQSEASAGLAPATPPGLAKTERAKPALATNEAARPSPAKPPVAAVPSDPFEALALDQWRAERYAARIAFTANYVSARARVHSTLDLRNAAMWMETCISNKAAQPGASAVAGALAASCFSELSRRP